MTLETGSIMVIKTIQLKSESLAVVGFYLISDNIILLCILLLQQNFKGTNHWIMATNNGF